MSFLFSMAFSKEEHHYLACMQSFIQLQPCGIIVSSAISDASYELLQCLAGEYGVKIIRFEPFTYTGTFNLNQFIKYTNECVAEYNKRVEEQYLETTLCNDVVNFVLKPYLKINDICYVPPYLVLSEDSEILPLHQIDYSRIMYDPSSKWIRVNGNIQQYHLLHVYEKTKWSTYAGNKQTNNTFRNKKIITVKRNPVFVEESKASKQRLRMNRTISVA